MHGKLAQKCISLKHPIVSPGLQLQGSSRERGGGGFGVTLGDRERRWGKRGHLAFPPLLSESHSDKRAQLGGGPWAQGGQLPGVTKGN